MTFPINNLNPKRSSREAVCSRGLLLSSLAGLVIGLGGCETIKGSLPIVTQADASPNNTSAAAYTGNLPITDPARTDDHNTAWQKILRNTDSQAISSDRISVKAKGSLFGGTDTPDDNFFIRAAADTLSAGREGFVIVHLDFYSAGPKFFQLSPDVNVSSNGWIGTYESYLEHKNTENMFSSHGAADRKALEGVVLMLDANDYPNRERFLAKDIYMNFMQDRH